MRDCCRDTYKKTLEEVILFMDSMRGKSIISLYVSLKYAVSMSKEKEKESLKIYFNEWVDK